MKKLFYELKLLLRSIPSLVMAFFVVSIVTMNMLANKSIVNLDFLALDAGFLMSWIAFLTMDVITKRFGPRAATLVSFTGIFVNLVVCAVFFLAKLIPGIWGESYVDGSEAIINTALDNTFGGTWYILLGSTIAFLVSAIVNNFSNYGIGKIVKKKDGFLVYALRSYVSTAIGQFVDNLVFALIVSKVFFGWTMLQCFTCALTGMVFELLCEVVFSPLGFKIFKQWEVDGVGNEYIEYIESKGKSVE